METRSQPFRQPSLRTGGTAMLDQLLPQRADNTYRGHKLALWLFGLVLLVKLAIGVNFPIHGHTVASSADGIPLDTFTPAREKKVVSLFAAWGLAQGVICALCIVVLATRRFQVRVVLV